MQSRALLRLVVVVYAALVAVGSGHDTNTTTTRKHTHHHHCIHDHQSARFDASVDQDSLTVPQQLMPFESPAEHATNAFLDLVGVDSSARRLRGHRSLTASADASPFQPIRIVFDLSKLTNDPGYMCVNEGDTVQVDGGSYTCSSSDVLTSAKREFLVSVLLKALKDYFEATLSVQRVLSNLIVRGISCSSTDEWACCSRSIPSSYKTEGVANADYVLHVTARPTTGSTIAWALPCNIDQYGRPISGHANFGPARIDPVTASARTEQIGTAIHEMTHALVFSKGRFYDFRQPLNGDKWGYDNVVYQTQSTGGIWVSKIVTPNVAKQAKQHFNCPSWINPGIELENGDSGSAEFSSHWEKRMLMNEYMTATSSYDPVYSAMTLALFEDSGWYQVTYKGAQVLPWGYMEGCGVAQSRCSEWNSRYICKQSSETSCTADYTSKGYCNVATYRSSIPAGFQYFQDPKFGGRDSYADYCPFYRAYSNGDCRGIGRVATYADTGNYMEEVGPSSRCFTSSLSKTSSDTAALRSACYRIVGCNASGLRLSIGGKEVVCPLAGGEIRVSGYNGRLMCPTGANRLCQMLQDQCSGNGVLLSTGECQCNPGYVGQDCSGIACPKSTDTGAECGGSSRGTCDYKTGECACTRAYTGLACTELVCPVNQGKADGEECSGHGTCDRAFGTCRCADGYSGKACECVPGCTSTSCGDHGTCDCTTGACACDAGYSGLKCTTTGAPPIVELREDTPPHTDTLAAKEYKFFKVYLNASSYDVTFVLTYPSDVDVDLYGSFADPYPTSLSSKSQLFSSDYAIGSRDEINLCGSLGVFPRGLNDTFRFCPRATAPYILETPGYFYLSVLGYEGGAYTLSIETDKCKNVDCSGHGKCGVNFPGICSCDRYWSGDDCSVPRCGPDCSDLGTCTASLNTPTIRAAQRFLSANPADEDDPTSVFVNYQVKSNARSPSSPLRNTSECYGNGVCVVGPDPMGSGKDVPQCECDEAFRFTNPTAPQALCKELLPSVAYIQHFTEPFRVQAELSDLQLGVNAWALYTLQIKDAWEVLVVNLAITTPETDAMLFVRKEKLPSVVVRTNQTTQAPLQFMDSDGWTSGSTTRKIVLTRASSTLSSGMYYIGVFNSAYARAPLGYRLAVNATANCTASSSASGSSSSDTNAGSDSTLEEEGYYGICLHGGQCRAQTMSICTCPRDYSGRFCELRVARPVLSNNASTSASSVSYTAFETPTTQLLDIGEWEYLSFEVNDPSVRLIQFQLVIENDLSDATPTLPLLLVRGPSDDGFPTLFSESQQDFVGISQRKQRQVVTLAVDEPCSFAETLKDCYKVALFNRKYSGNALRYRFKVEHYRSRSAIFPSPGCGSTGDAVNCNGRGKCLLIPDDKAVINTTVSVPSCQCATGWTGLQCNSPKSFDLPQLWSAMNNISLLCSACATSFSLARGQVKMFRVPESLRDNSGIRLSVLPIGANGAIANASSSGARPNVYVSEVLPRTIYDFTHISKTPDASKDPVLELTNASFSGHFWVVVFTDYPSSDVVELTSSRRTRTRRFLADTATPASTYQLQAEVYELPEGTDSSSLLTRRTFASEVFRWLFHSPIGIAVFVFCVVFLTLAVGYFLWRVCNAPENQDKTTRRFFGGTSAEHAPTNGPRLRAPVPSSSMATSHVSDVELGTPVAPRVSPRRR